tara:strand:+ start:110 stop:358 length:249 start_codon:yes stop_codon:yes gene_type:complete
VTIELPASFNVDLAVQDVVRMRNGQVRQQIINNYSEYIYNCCKTMQGVQQFMEMCQEAEPDLETQLLHEFNHAINLLTDWRN